MLTLVSASVRMLFTGTIEIPINKKKMYILSYYTVQGGATDWTMSRERYLFLKNREMFFRSFLAGFPSYLIDKTGSHA